LERVLRNCERESYRGFIRFGDGEYQLIRGLGIAFQKASGALSTDLAAALHNEKNLDVDIAIDVFSYNEIRAMKLHKRVSFFPWSFFFIKECRSGEPYLYTKFTMPYFLFRRNGGSRGAVEGYIRKFNKLFEDKKVTLFIGEGIYKKIRFLPFEKSLDVAVEKCPSSNSYEAFQDILSRAREYGSVSCVLS